MMDHMQILVRATDCGIHLTVTELDCYLHKPESPIAIKEFT
jgi:hypothetical protein